MSGQKNTKLKLLYLKDILEKYTDDAHILNAGEIADKLSENGVECERKSIYKDIDVLIEYGLDIIKTRTPKTGFFLASRAFELPEVRLLSDAVQAADFISIKKTKTLLSKIDCFVSKSQAQALKQQIYIDSRPKCSNEEIYYNIDKLDNAIKLEKKVKLSYYRRKLDDKYTAHSESREFVLSPYALIWADDHYYLVANNAKYDNLMHLRIDRIKNAEITDEDARRFSEVSEYKTCFDAADYSSKTFNMFSGKSESVELKCKNELLEEMLDRFGEKTVVRKADDSSFYIRVDAAVNDGIASWIMQFGSNLEVVFPDSLRKMVREKAKAVYYVYDNGDKNS